MPPYQQQQLPPQMPQIQPDLFVPELPRGFKEKWGQVQAALGIGKPGNPRSLVQQQQAGTQKQMRFLGGVSIWTNFGGAAFIMLCAGAAWFYGASSSVDWIREQTWGKFVDRDFWNVAIWPLLLLATLYIIAATPLSFPDTVDEWVSDSVWLIFVAVDVMTNVDRMGKWLPTFVLPGSNETIKWLWVIPIVVVVFSVAISYFPERIFWSQIIRLGNLRIQLRYQRAVKDYLEYQESQLFQQMYRNGNNAGPAAGGRGSGSFTRYQ